LYVGGERIVPEVKKAVAHGEISGWVPNTAVELQYLEIGGSSR
jgi:hypothetical protein